jgi:hypothetical protein
MSESPTRIHLLTGDFNTQAPGTALETNRMPLRLRPLVWSTSGGQIRWRTIQRILDTGYADAYPRNIRINRA